MINVLIVDDEPGILEVTKIFLERTGQFNVTSENSAKTALLMLNTDDFDAVVSDYEMPGLNGIEFLKLVRKNGNSIPFIIFTGRSREDVVIEALNCGVDSYIQKGGDLKSQFAELTHRIITSVEKKKAENKLFEANEYNKCLIEAHVDPLVTIDCNGFIDDVNNSMEKITFRKRDSLIGLSFRDIFTKPDEVSEALSLVLRNEEISDYPLVLKTGNGETVPVLLFATLYHTGNSCSKGKSQVKGIFAELHYAEDGGASVHAGKRNFNDDFYMNLITHDIKNAVCTGFGYCEILKNTAGISADAVKYLKKTEGCLKRIEMTLTCVKCLESISRDDYTPESFSLDEIIEREISCYTKNTINYERTGAFVLADGLLGSVFENIFGNAVKHGSSETEIYVAAADKGRCIEITVEDNSSGMPPEIMKKLSEGEFINNRPSGRNGFGLYIVSSLLNRYCGSISAHERVKGEPWMGTSVVFTLLKAGMKQADSNENEAVSAMHQTG